MTYNGRECVIEALPVQAFGGFVALAVTISENGTVIDTLRSSVGLDGLRSRANDNETSVAVERDADIAALVTQAEARFRDIVDAES